MSDILIKLSNDTVKIKDIIPENISEDQLLNAVEAYLKSLPRNKDAYNYLKNIKGLGGKTLNSDYLSGGLALAVRSIHKTLIILDFYDDPSIDEATFRAPTWENFKTNKLTIWNENEVNLNTQLKASIEILEFYTKDNKDFDIDKVLNDAKEILGTIKKFDNSGDGTDYNAFIEKIGLKKEGDA